MATNKRKEAAALFELIDKSTLKISKSGSLKIPSWWSSKTNPPAPPETPSTSPQTPPTTPPTPPPAVPRASLSITPAPDPSSVDTDVALLDNPLSTPQEYEIPAQPRLFQPPPPNVAPPTSPSIRPPLAHIVASPVTVSPISAAPVPAPAPSIAPPPPVPHTPAYTPEARQTPSLSSKNDPPATAARPAPTPPPAARVFAPQTAAQGRKPWTPPRPGAFARLPLWAVIAAGAGALLIVCILIAVGRSATKQKPAPPGQTAARGGGPATGATLLTGRGAVNPPPAPAGRIYKGGEVSRMPEQYYIVVYTTPVGNATAEGSLAYKHAKFLADHGIDVSIEAVRDRNQMWYWVVTAKGASTAAAANSFLAQIKTLGKQMGSDSWKDAYPLKGLSQPGSEAPPK